LLLAALLVVFVAAPSTADSVTHVTARFFGGSETDRTACQRLVDGAAPSTAAERAAAANQVSVCLDLARDALASASDLELLQTYRAVEHLAAWARGDRRLASQWAGVESDARSHLASRGMAGGAYAAMLRAQLVRVDPGGYIGETSNAPDLGLSTWAADLAIESEHMPLGRSWDFSLTFDAARRPLFVMVKTPDGTVAPAFVPGVATSTGFRVAHASRSTETAIVGEIGGTRLNSEDATFGSGAQSTRAVVAANDMSQWALFMNGSIDFRWYPRDVWLVHLTTEPLDPLLHIAAGVKHDQRFHRTADLEPYEDPTGRIFFGFDVTPVRVPSQRASILTLGAGFDFEGALRRTGRLPSGYQATLSANLDILMALAHLRR
jgi:hypothetical protein